jgi:hypothetical protein
MFGVPLVLAGAALIVVVLTLPIIWWRRPDPARRRRAVMWVGFGVLTAFSLLAGLFTVGEAFAEPGGSGAVPAVLSWLVPALLLVALALLAPRLGAWVMAGLFAVMVGAALWSAVDPATWRLLEDQLGPIRAVAVFVVAAALGVLGLKRTAVAGWLLLGIGVIPIIISSLGSAVGAQPLLAVSVIPVITGALYLISAGLTGHRVAMTGGPGKAAAGAEDTSVMPIGSPGGQ